MAQLPSWFGRALSGAGAIGLTCLVACGGKQLGGPADGGVFTEPDGATCVDIVLSTFDQSCRQDSDCTLIVTGDICSRDCLCGGSPINVSGMGRYESELSALPSSAQLCDCAFPGAPRCIHDVCTLCTPGSTDPACNDGGAGGGGDGGNTTSDGGACAVVDAATYDTSCNVAADCFLIQTGTICDGSCECGGTPVNVSGQARYEKAVSGIMFAACPCALAGPIECVMGQCTVCGPGGPSGCTDGG